MTPAYGGIITTIQYVRTSRCALPGEGVFVWHGMRHRHAFHIHYSVVGSVLHPKQGRTAVCRTRATWPGGVCPMRTL